jgi:hypothetical protein
MILATFAGAASIHPVHSHSSPPASLQSCTPEARLAALRALQEQVLQVVPRQVDSLEKAIQPGGPLAGWRLSHGLVVLSSAGAVAVDNITAKEPVPPVLLYAPSPSSSPAAWTDFDGEDGPYRLVGWAYIGPYTPGSKPPVRPCIAASEWLVHEAGWHLKDGGMTLTTDAAAEPAHPQLKAGIHFWHPQVWDLHVWAGADGVPTIAYANPKAPGGGVRLPAGSFYRIVDGRKQLIPEP